MRVCKFSSNEFAHLQKIDPPFILHNENSIKVTTILQFKVKDEKFNYEEQSEAILDFVIIGTSFFNYQSSTWEKCS